MTPKIKKDKKIINRILNKAVEQIIPSPKALEKKLLSGKRLSVYQGFDPTGPTLHIGHTVMMRKLEDFRKLGHKVIFLIGDFTAMIGDPDKNSARVKLTKEEVQKNLKLYKKQAAKIIDVNNKENPVEIVFNSKWLSKLTFEDTLELASHFSIQQIIKREMFQKRMKEGTPVYLHELLYPIMQAYDSVQLNVDVNMGGNDQLLNILPGRHLAEALGKKEQIVLTGKLLGDPNQKKMGKTTGNMVSFLDKPRDVYGKIMSMADSQIIQSFELITSYSMKQVAEAEKKLKQGVNPMELKKELAWEVTKDLHSESDANKAQKFFENVYQTKNDSAKLPEIKVKDFPIEVVELLHSIWKIADSKSKARRLIKQGAVKIDGKKCTDIHSKIEIETKIRCGKRIGKVVKR